MICCRNRLALPLTGNPTSSSLTIPSGATGWGWSQFSESSEDLSELGRPATGGPAASFCCVSWLWSAPDPSLARPQAAGNGADRAWLAAPVLALNPGSGGGLGARTLPGRPTYVPATRRIRPQFNLVSSSFTKPQERTLVARRLVMFAMPGVPAPFCGAMAKGARRAGCCRSGVLWCFCLAGGLAVLCGSCLAARCPDVLAMALLFFFALLAIPTCWLRAGPAARPRPILCALYCGSAELLTSRRFLSITARYMSDYVNYPVLASK